MGVKNRVTSLMDDPPKLIWGTDLEQLDNIWMVQSLHDSNFTEKFLKTPGIKLSFVDDFYRNLESKKNVSLKAELLIFRSNYY